MQILFLGIVVFVFVVATDIVVFLSIVSRIKKKVEIIFKIRMDNFFFTSGGLKIW